MRIAFFCWEYPPRIFGGLGTYADYMTRTLAQQGHEITVYSAAGPELPERTTYHGVEVIRPPVVDARPLFPHVITDELQGWGDFFAQLLTNNLACASEFLLRDARQRRYDVVAVQDWLHGMAGLILAEQSPAPVVFHVHSAEWGRRSDGGSPPVLHWEGRLAHVAKQTITVSHAMRDDLVSHGWDGARITVVWNGVDPERYSPAAVPADAVAALRQRYGLAPEDRVLLYVGRLNWVKGAANLLRAMPSIVHQHPAARLVVLGRGEDEQLIQGLASADELRGNVHLRLEFVPEDERIAHYALADLCVFPSLYEPFGIVSLEAMAMEKPVVVGASGVVGFREQVVPQGAGRTGSHVNGADPADIAWGVSNALAAGDELQEWGRNGRRRVERMFTWQQAATRTAEAYRRAARAGAG
jgi:glycosyltransferase involved in cell wall biosynthesis